MVKEDHMLQVELLNQLMQRRIEGLWPDITTFASELAESMHPERGGLAVGYKDCYGSIRTWGKGINIHYPSRWGDPEDQYELYAVLKLGTALRKESNTQKRAKEFLPLEAVHQGGVVRFFDQTWVGVGFSGFTGEEDERIAIQVLNNFFSRS